jgi:hypothetical protein
MRLLLYGDEVEILRRNYKHTWSSNFEFPQKYITHQTAICFNPRTRNVTGHKKNGLTVNRPTHKHVFDEIVKRITFFNWHKILTKVCLNPAA